MTKKMILPAAAIAIVAAGILVTSGVSAHGFGQDGTFAQRFAGKFGLNESDVTTFMQQMHDEHHAQREEQMEERLSQAVENGTITEPQKQLILEKHEEMQAKFEALKDASPEQRRETMRQHHEEMQQWAAENDIDLHSFMMGFGLGRRGGWR